MDLEKIVGKNWLNDREALIKQEQRPGRKESWLDCVNPKLLIKTYNQGDGRNDVWKAVDCIRLENGNFGLILKPNEGGGFYAHELIEFNEFGIVDMDTGYCAKMSLTDTTKLINLINAGRKIEGKTYDQCYLEEKLNSLSRMAWWWHDEMTGGGIHASFQAWEDYHRSLKPSESDAYKEAEILSNEAKMVYEKLSESKLEK